MSHGGIDDIYAAPERRTTLATLRLNSLTIFADRASFCQGKPTGPGRAGAGRDCAADGELTVGAVCTSPTSLSAGTGTEALVLVIAIVFSSAPRHASLALDACPEQERPIFL